MLASNALPTPERSLAIAQARQALIHGDAADLRIPPGGLVYAPERGPGNARLDGRRVSPIDGEFRIRSLPAELVIERTEAKRVSAAGG